MFKTEQTILASTKMIQYQLLSKEVIPLLVENISLTHKHTEAT